MSVCILNTASSYSYFGNLASIISLQYVFHLFLKVFVKIYLLIENRSDREETGDNLPLADSLHKWSQWPELSHCETLYLGSSSTFPMWLAGAQAPGPSFAAFPRPLAGSWSLRNTNTYMRSPCCAAGSFCHYAMVSASTFEFFII